MTSVSEALSHNRDAIGIGRKGTIDKPYLLKAPFWTVDTLFYAIPKSDINLEFALCSFLNVDWKSKDESTGLPSLSKESINETVLSVPNVVEQNHLGNFFADLDRLITLHQRKRCNGPFTHPLVWEQRKLGELLLFQNGFNGSSESFGSGIPLISVMDVLDDEFITHETVRGKARLIPKKLAAIVLSTVMYCFSAARKIRRMPERRTCILTSMFHPLSEDS